MNAKGLVVCGFPCKIAEFMTYKYPSYNRSNGCYSHEFVCLALCNSKTYAKRCAKSTMCQKLQRHSNHILNYDCKSHYITELAA